MPPTTTPSTTVRPADPTLRAALRLALLFAAVRLLFQFACTLWTQHLGYGYFRDEFYYIACGHHLAWGFVDHGPIVALQARVAELLFGRSLFGIRLLSALAIAVAVFLTGIVTWALGGGRSAQALALLGVSLAPMYIGQGGFLSMNSFEPMFWTACILALALLLRGYSAPRCWIAFGLSAGIGLLNKPSMAFFLIALGLGLLCTAERRILFTRAAAVGIALLLLIALPNVLWQIHNHWPTLEFLHNGRVRHKNTSLPPLQFVLAQILMLHPLNAFLWITGVVALLRAKSIRHFRWLGLTYIFFLVLMAALHAKDYYLGPIYPAFFAAGSIAWEHRFALTAAVKRGALFAFPVYETALTLTAALILPMASPILRPAPWIAYTAKLHLYRAPDETEATSLLPQFYADRFGWQELADQVVTAFRALPLDDQRDVCIYADNYGEAGAIDFLARHAEPRLPPAISRQNSYWMWGTHGCTGRVILSITDSSLAGLTEVYEHVTIVGTMSNPLAMPEEQKHIYLLRDRKPGHPIDWADHRNYI